MKKKLSKPKRVDIYVVYTPSLRRKGIVKVTESVASTARGRSVVNVDYSKKDKKGIQTCIGVELLDVQGLYINGKKIL